ncbi:MAG: dockerin type I domain-containing protein [Gammaproteobacteria bacterium]|nr:dockerin type I domain-containing protein [Gammaproteobacteria bacterium]
MKKVSLAFGLTVFLLQPIFVSAEETCVELNAPVTSVADFDGNGIVNGQDIAMLAKAMRKNKGGSSYVPMFDRNADGEVDNIDLFKATRDMKKKSTAEDQKLATISLKVIEGTYTCTKANRKPVIQEPAPLPLSPLNGPAPSV